MSDSEGLRTVGIVFNLPASSGLPFNEITIRRHSHQFQNGVVTLLACVEIPGPAGGDWRLSSKHEAYALFLNEVNVLLLIVINREGDVVNPLTNAIEELLLDGRASYRLPELEI